MPKPLKTYTPAELARELGYANEDRSRKVVRDYLREHFPEHVRNERWVLDEDQAADVRANVPRNNSI